MEHAWDLSAARLRERGRQPLGLIWEVDPPQAGDDAAERMLRERRVEFFRRQGGALLPQPYLQPPVDGIAPVPMQLMFRPASDGRPPDDETAHAIVRAIYFEKYQAVNQIPEHVLRDLLERT